MAPEQILGKKRGHTSAPDVYSLGVILYEMLTGEAAFITAATTWRVMYRARPGQGEAADRVESVDPGRGSQRSS